MENDGFEGAGCDFHQKSDGVLNIKNDIGAIIAGDVGVSIVDELAVLDYDPPVRKALRTDDESPVEFDIIIRDILVRRAKRPVRDVNDEVPNGLDTVAQSAR